MHVLVVEDDPIVADILGMTSEEAGYFKTTANTIETAILELKQNQIDAVLLDINLPDGDGNRLSRLISKNHVPVPILVVSGNSGIDDKITALKTGSDGYLTKPFDRCELVAIHVAFMIGRLNTPFIHCLGGGAVANSSYKYGYAWSGTSTRNKNAQHVRGRCYISALAIL